MSSSSLSNSQVRSEIKTLNLEWSLEDDYLEKRIEFKNFDDAFEFMTRVAAICKAQNHHPYWINDYKHLTVKLRTADSDGITEKDIKLAIAIDHLIKYTA